MLSGRFEKWGRCFISVDFLLYMAFGANGVKVLVSSKEDRGGM